MRHLENGNISERAIAAAIRAVEAQRDAKFHNAGEKARHQRERLFALMDQFRGPLFEHINDAIKAGKREVSPAAVREFKEGFNSIFQLGFGIFDPDMLNDWLYTRDLKHIFFADQGTIKW